MGTHGRQQMDVRPGDPRVEDVAADGHDQAFQLAAQPPDGQRVEQGLRRMGMHAVAGIDDGAVDLFGQQLGRTGS